MDSEGAWTPKRIDAIPAWTLIRASHAVGHALAELFAEHQLTPVQFGVLAQLSATPDLNASELARRVLIRSQSMGEVLSTLVERGLLMRQGPGGRGRPVAVALTNQGRDVLRSAQNALGELHAARRLGLAPPELRRLNELLHQVITALDTRR